MLLASSSFMGSWCLSLAAPPSRPPSVQSYLPVTWTLICTSCDLLLNLVIVAAIMSNLALPVANALHFRRCLQPLLYRINSFFGSVPCPSTVATVLSPVPFQDAKTEEALGFCPDLTPSESLLWCPGNTLRCPLTLLQASANSKWAPGTNVTVRFSKEIAATHVQPL